MKTKLFQPKNYEVLFLAHDFFAFALTLSFLLYPELFFAQSLNFLLTKQKFRSLLKAFAHR